jgi:hypothetical protein
MVACLIYPVEPRMAILFFSKLFLLGFRLISSVCVTKVHEYLTIYAIPLLTNEAS